mgnify:CR=1 FL=1
MSTKQSIEAWIASFKREIVETDINAFHAQWELWSRFSQYPDFPQAGEEVFEGWLPDRYLDWSNMTFDFYLKPVKQSFWARIGPAMRWLFTGREPVKMGDLVYELASASDKGSLQIKVTFNKKKGHIEHQIWDAEQQRIGI